MFDFEEKRPSEIPIVVLDTEATGLFPGLGHRLVEVGAVRLENWEVVGSINQLVQPGRAMTPKASAVSSIDDQMLVDKPTFAEIAGELLALLDGALLVAHNATFDANLLGMEFFISGHTFTDNALPAKNQGLPNPWLCTLRLARRHFYFGKNNLGYIARKLGVRIGHAHRALNDVYITLEVFKRMVYELKRAVRGQQRLETVGDLLYAQGEPIYAPPPPDVFLPAPIAEALENGRQLRILYIGNAGEIERIITPRYPSRHRGVSYLIAYCHLRQEQRAFRIDHIFSAEPVAPE